MPDPQEQQLEPLVQTALGRDSALLAAIARRADQQALVEFFERHHKPAYTFALRLTRSAEEAEEVLQEAIWTVWQRAAAFRSEGSARSWFLKIVALKALRRLRSERQALRQRQVVAQISLVAGQVPKGAEEQVAFSEQALHLRAAMTRLPEMEQRLIALHYGAEMRISEIARCCAMPRQTVTVRLHHALSMLRSVLSRACPVAIPPSLWAELLRQEFLGVPRVPADLGARILQGISSRTAPACLRAAPTKGSALKVAGCVLALAVLALAGFGAVERLVRPVQLGSSVVPDREPLPYSAPGPRTPEEESEFFHRFSFSTRDHTRFPCVFSPALAPWNWIPPLDGRPGALAVGLREDLHCLLPVKVPPRPLLLEIVVRFPKNIHPINKEQTYPIAGGGLWADEGSTPPYRLFKSREVWALRRRYLLQIYFFDRYDVCLWDPDSVFYLHEYEQPYPGNRIYLQFRTFEVEEIRVRGLQAGEIPAKISNPQALIRELGVAPKLQPRELFRLAPPSERSSSPDAPSL